MAKSPKPFNLMKMYILLALADGPQHGLGVHERVQSDSQSSLYFSFTTLYRQLRELENDGLVEAIGMAAGEGAHRSVYRLTAEGGRRLKWAAADLGRAVQLVRQRVS